jgi:hypothetical protein
MHSIAKCRNVHVYNCILISVLKHPIKFLDQRYGGGGSIYSSLEQRMEERADTLESNTKVVFIDRLY